MLPKIFLKDIRLMALSQIAKDELLGLRDAIYQLQLHDIDTVHESFLPFLAWIYRADEWSNEWPIERKRSVVKNALLLFQYKGTIWAVERALELSMFDASVIPWYAMNPVGTRGTFRIDAMPSDSRSLTQSDYTTFVTLTESNKQASQHWTGNIKHDPSLGTAYAAPVIRTRKRWVSDSIVPLHVTDITIEPASIIVYEGEPVSVSATVQMSDGTTTHDVRFESSDAAIVTVDEAGLVTFAGEGDASVYAISTFNNVSSAECVVSALHAIVPVAVSINDFEQLYVSESGQFSATVTYSDSNVISSIDDASIVVWSSSDESILTIDDNGNYTVLAVGDVTIRATSTEDAAIIGEVETSTAIDYDFIMTVAESSKNPGYFGYSQAGSYGSVEPDQWAASSEHVIAGVSTHTQSPQYLLRLTCSGMEPWAAAQNIKMKFYSGTESAETPVSSGFTYLPSGFYDFDDAPDAYFLIRENEFRDVYVKVLDASLETNNDIEMTIGEHEGSSFKAWGYRAESSTGETSSTYNSGRAIETCYVRDDTYGMILQGGFDNELWNGWEYVTATWEVDDGTSHEYAGRLLMHPTQGFYASSVIDDELIALMQSNIDKSATVTLSQAETPSNVIEIVIGEVEIGTGDTAYGLRPNSSTGTLVSGEFPDASPIINVYARTKSFGCLLSGSSDGAYWNYWNSIDVEWVFEDESSYVFPSQLTTTTFSDGSRGYRSTTIDETLIEMISSRVGQTAKIIVTESGASRLLTRLHWEFDDGSTEV